MKRLLVLSALGLALVSRLAATQIHPVSYSYIQGPWGYWDETGEQLTDGLYNSLVPQVNLATPNPYNWVGFGGGTPSFTFDFGASVTVHSVSFSMAKWTPAAVYLPSQIRINTSAFNIDDNAYVDMNHALVGLSGSWTGSSLTVSMTPAYYWAWTFIDEVTFEGTASSTTNSVPDSAPTAVLFGAALLAVLGSRPLSRRN